ncbi:MAG: glycosyltransferase [Deltaproteobacteria bacterium]|nr:glycosyltransferase [Deltaproteobacteria bacterium]
MALPRRILFPDHELLLRLNEGLVWYSGLPAFVGLLLCLIDFFVLLPSKRHDRSVPFIPIAETDKVTVLLTAYNDESSIGQAVEDFIRHPRVARVVVVSNNSSDRTEAVAAEAGAIIINEPKPGYGRCVFRCLEEASKFEDTTLTLLCEGDMTFRGHDLEKFLAYAPHANIVNGTRISERLREYRTQLSTFMYYGNFAVGKLLEVKHLGRGTFTDVGTTYKLFRNDALRRVLPHLNPAINLEFNAHFLDVALSQDELVIECPITFYPRVGVSKGGNADNLRALKVGLKMILGLYSNWRFFPR